MIKTVDLSKIRIDRRMSLPIAEQLRDHIIDLILDDTLTLESILPLPHELADLVDCSIKDVEGCYTMLEKDYYVIWEKPNAPKVWRFPLYSNFSQGMTTVVEMITRLGLKLKITLIEQKTIKIDNINHETTHLDVGLLVYYHRRVFYGNDIPFAIIDHYTPTKTAPQLPDWFDVSKPLFPQLRMHNYLPVTSTDYSIRSVIYDKSMSSLLKLRENAVGLQVLNLIKDKDSQIIESDLTYFTNRYYFDLNFKI